MKKLVIGIVTAVIGLLLVGVIRVTLEEKRYEDLLPSDDVLPVLTGGTEQEVQEAMELRELIIAACHMKLRRMKFFLAEWLASAIEQVFGTQTEVDWWLTNGPSLLRDKRLVLTLAELGGIEHQHLYDADGTSILPGLRDL